MCTGHAGPVHTACTAATIARLGCARTRTHIHMICAQASAIRPPINRATHAYDWVAHPRLPCDRFSSNNNNNCDSNRSRRTNFQFMYAIFSDYRQQTPTDRATSTAPNTTTAATSEHPPPAHVALSLPVAPPALQPTISMPQLAGGDGARAPAMHASAPHLAGMVMVSAGARAQRTSSIAADVTRSNRIRCECRADITRLHNRRECAALLVRVRHRATAL